MYCQQKKWNEKNQRHLKEVECKKRKLQKEQATTFEEKNRTDDKEKKTTKQNGNTNIFYMYS